MITRVAHSDTRTFGQTGSARTKQPRLGLRSDKPPISLGQARPNSDIRTTRTYFRTLGQFRLGQFGQARTKPSRVFFVTFSPWKNDFCFHFSKNDHRDSKVGVQTKGPERLNNKLVPGSGLIDPKAQIFGPRRPKSVKKAQAWVKLTGNGEIRKYTPIIANLAALRVLTYFLQPELIITCFIPNPTHRFQLNRAQLKE